MTVTRPYADSDPFPQPDGREPAPGRLAVVQDFANAHFAEAPQPDRERRVEPMAEWFARHGVDGGAPLRVTPAAIKRTLAFRGAVRSLMEQDHGSPIDAAAVATLNEIAAGVPLVVRFDHGEPHLHPAASGLDAAFGRLLAIISDASRDGTWQRLKICRADDCRWAYYDTSKNRSGAWCSMADCGNRAKARAYRQRQRR